MRFAKERGTAVVLVGHVTKDGTIAGPRVLEHMVDTVLSFEGERSHQYRILRAMKNRFGGTDEIGVFAMEGEGLTEVPNPSALFLTHRGEPVSGTSVFPAIEGSRPVLVEIQALMVRLASGATPRRAAVGWDSGRLAMILAVLEARCGLSFATAEVYLNVAGGYRLSDPAPTSRSPRLWSRRCPSGRCRAKRWCSARSRCRAKSAPSPTPGCGSRNRPSSGSRRAWVPKGVKGGEGLRLAEFANLRELVDQILGRLGLAKRRQRPLAAQPMTALDVFVFLLLIGGAAIGFVRGFVHEVISLFAWIVAIAMLKLFHTQLWSGLENSFARQPGGRGGARLRDPVRAQLPAS